MLADLDRRVALDPVDGTLRVAVEVQVDAGGQHVAAGQRREMIVVLQDDGDLGLRHGAPPAVQVHAAQSR